MVSLLASKDATVSAELPAIWSGPCATTRNEIKTTGEELQANAKELLRQVNVRRGAVAGNDGKEAMSFPLKTRAVGAVALDCTVVVGRRDG
jgi:hypothetical protein